MTLRRIWICGPPTNDLNGLLYTQKTRYKSDVISSIFFVGFMKGFL